MNKDRRFFLITGSEIDYLQKKIASMSKWKSSDGQDLVMVSDVLTAIEEEFISKQINKKFNL